MNTYEHHEMLDAAIRLILEDGRITISVTGEEISISLPRTRRLAEHLGIPHYYVLPHFAAMEKDGLIRRAERVGISTTKKGTDAIVSIIDQRYAGIFSERFPKKIIDLLREPPR